MGIIAYKGFESDLSCRGFQYEVGKTYKLPETETLELCRCGFHASPTLSGTFQFYNPLTIESCCEYILGKEPCCIVRSPYRYCEVELDGFNLNSFYTNKKYSFFPSNNKFCAAQIKINRELSEKEIRSGIEYLKSSFFDADQYYEKIKKSIENKYFKKNKNNGLWYVCSSSCDEAISSDDFWNIITYNGLAFYW